MERGNYIFTWKSYELQVIYYSFRITTQIYFEI